MSKMPVLVTWMMSNVNEHDVESHVAVHALEITQVVDVPLLITSPQLGAAFDMTKKNATSSATSSCMVPCTHFFFL